MTTGECPKCLGRGTIPFRATTVVCPECNGARWTHCAHGKKLGHCPECDKLLAHYETRPTAPALPKPPRR